MERKTRKQGHISDKHHTHTRRAHTQDTRRGKKNTKKQMKNTHQKHGESSVGFGSGHLRQGRVVCGRWSVSRSRPLRPVPSASLLAPSVSIHQHTSAYVNRRWHTSAYVSIRQHTSAYVSIRHHTSAYVSIRWHTLTYVGIRRQDGRSLWVADC